MDKIHLEDKSSLNEQ